MRSSSVDTEKEEHRQKEQQVGSTDIYSWVSLKVGYPKFTNYHHVSPIKMTIWIDPI